MASHVTNNAYVSINSVDLSDHVRQLELKVTAEEQDNTAMGNSGFSSTLTGLKTGELTVEFNQDYAAAKVYATLVGLFGSSFPIAVRPDAGAISSTNPEWQGTGQLFEFTYIAGQVGQVNVTPVTIKVSGAITADTTP